MNEALTGKMNMSYGTWNAGRGSFEENQ